MKRNSALRLSAFLLVTLAAGTCLAAGDDTPTAPALNGPHMLTERKVRLIGESNVVRSGPGNSFAIVGVYSKGSDFLVIAKRGEWYNIRLSDTETGWIHSSLCKEFDDMSDLEFRPNPRMFSRIGSFDLTAYTGAYAFDRKSNSIVLGGRLGYYVLEFVELEGSVSWTHVVRPAEIVESLFNLRLEEERFDMLFYSMNMNVQLLPGRQMVPFLTGGAGSSIMRGQTETTFNYGIGTDLFLKKSTAVRFEFRDYNFKSGTADARRKNMNFEFSVGASFLL